jgi:hypothetical protein
MFKDIVLWSYQDQGEEVTKERSKLQYQELQQW